MQQGTQPLGTAVVVHVGASLAAATTLVGGLVSWDYGDDVPTTTRNYYQMASYISVGKHARTITLTCDYLSADSGQIILFAAKTSVAVTYVKILPDGTNGETLPCRVTSAPIAGGDVAAPSTVTFSLVQATDPTVVAGGFGT